MSDPRNIILLIPPITDPMGQGWRQPDRSDLTLTDDGYILISKKDFDALYEYSRSLPSGMYEGKMWKCQTQTGWFLCWYDIIPNRFGNRDYQVYYRPIIIKEMADLLGL